MSQQIIVTTGDIAQPYDILGPVYFQVSNKGILSSSLDTLKRHYAGEIQRMKSSGSMSEDRCDWGFLYGEWSVGQSDFEAAFFIATEEMKKRARLVGADAIIGMRQDIDMDTNGFAFFYLQMYGTAVKLRDDLGFPAAQYERAEELMRQEKYAEAEAIYYRLGDFRDSKTRAQDAYAAILRAKYRHAEELMLSKNYSKAQQMFTVLRDYKDSRAKAEMAHQAEEEEKAARLAAALREAELREAERKAAALRTADRKAADLASGKTWICPNCGKENVYFIGKCSCGTAK